MLNYHGFTKLVDMPSGFDPGYIMNVNDNVAFWIICGKDDIYKFDGTIFSKITESSVITAGGYNVNDPIEWSGCLLSKISIVNHPQSYPQFYNDSLATLYYLPWNNIFNNWSNQGERCRILRSHKQFLFALDLDSSDPNVGTAPDGVRWSAPADIGSVPPSWDPYDTTNVAGVTNLGGSGGRIIDGLSLRDSFVVYRQDSISIFDFIDGPLVWQIRNQSSTIGLINEDCVVEVNAIHYFIGRDDIYKNDGNTITALMDDKIKERFLSDLDIANFKNAFVVKYDIADEIWFCIPIKTIASATYSSRAFVYNWRDDTWTIIDLPNNTIRHAAYGSYTTSEDTWNTVTETWESVARQWNLTGVNPVVSTLIGIRGPDDILGEPTGSVIVMDSKTSLTGFPNKVYVERLGIPLEGLNNVTTITRIYPRMKGAGTVSIQIGSQDYPGSPVRWKAPVNFQPNLNRKIDVRTTGELHCFRFESSNIVSSTSWELSGLDIEYTNAGQR